MKFLLELVSCCGSSASSQQTISSPKEERRLLVGHVPVRRRPNRVHRGVKSGRRYSGRGSYPVGEWQPSLSSISEENAVLCEEKGGRRRIEGGRGRGGGGGGGGVAVVSADGFPSVLSMSTTKTRRSSSFEDRNGWTTFQAMPAFSPAPFMF